jgi:hypothetical protein
LYHQRRRKHIRKDLDPYVCVFDECETPFEIYSSSKEWLSHMRSQHCMRWHCFFTSHEPSFFQSPGALEQHLREIHAGQFSSEEMSFLVENSSHPSLSVIEQCPFCQETAENTEEHVAQHLIQFALRSLPWSEDDCSSSHPSQSSHSVSSAETDRDEYGMPEVRNEDWDAWEDEFQAERSPFTELGPPSTNERSDSVGLHEFMPPNYDAAEDDLLEPFRIRANVGMASATKQFLVGRQETVRQFVLDEEIYVNLLNLIAKVYVKAATEVIEEDHTPLDLLLEKVNRLLVLHEWFLNELKSAEFAGSQHSVLPNIADSSFVNSSASRPSPALIGRVLLENFRRLGPAHEEYSKAHQDATPYRKTILSQ